MRRLAVQTPHQLRHTSENVDPVSTNSQRENADLGFQSIIHWPAFARQRTELFHVVEQLPMELETLESPIVQLANDVSDQWNDN
jgi:hypothetical protein